MIGKELFGLVTLPRIPHIRCGCGKGYYEICEVHVFNHHTSQYRQDVHLLCRYCGRRRVHGVHISKEDYDNIGALVLRRVVKVDGDFWDTSVKPPRMKGRYVCGCGSTEHYFKQLHVYDDHIQLFTKCAKCGSVKQFDIHNYNRRVYYVGEYLHYSSTGHILVGGHNDDTGDSKEGR